MRRTPIIVSLLALFVAAIRADGGPQRALMVDPERSPC